MGNGEKGPNYAGSDIQAEMLRKHFDPESIRGKDVLVPSVEMQALEQLGSAGKNALRTLKNALLGKSKNVEMEGEMVHG